MKNKTALFIVIVLIALFSNCSSVDSLRNESIGSCLYNEYRMNYAENILTFECYNSERTNNLFNRPLYLDCLNLRKLRGYLAGTILFKNCQMSRIKYNISGTYTNFHTLNISGIELQYLPTNFFAGAQRLTTLIVSNNRLLEIPSLQFSHCPVLKDVDYSFNKISHIEEDAFGGVNVIKKLNLSHNHITTVPSKIFANLLNLEIVDLSHNSIDNLHPNNFVNLSSLELVDLSYNDIENLLPNIFVNLSKLETLDLSYNRIKSLQDAAILSQPNLQLLLLSHNNLTLIEMATFAKQKKLSFLDLSFNLLKQIDFRSRSPRMEHLEKFHINGNKLHDLDGFKNLLFPSLNSFAISGNRFSCSYLKKFLDVFEYHSSLSVLHRTNSTVNGEEEEEDFDLHGVNCNKDEQPSTLLNTLLLQETSTSVSVFSSTDKDTQIPQDNTTVESTRTTQDTQILLDTTTIQSMPSSKVMPNVRDSPPLLDNTTVSHTIKNLLIVLCVLVALNIGVMLIKFIRNRKENSITSATNYNCAYVTDISQRHPSVTENQYETVLNINKY